MGPIRPIRRIRPIGTIRSRCGACAAGRAAAGRAPGGGTAGRARESWEAPSAACAKEQNPGWAYPIGGHWPEPIALPDRPGRELVHETGRPRLALDARPRPYEEQRRAARPFLFIVYPARILLLRLRRDARGGARRAQSRRIRPFIREVSCRCARTDGPRRSQRAGAEGTGGARSQGSPLAAGGRARACEPPTFPAILPDP